MQRKKKESHASYNNCIYLHGYDHHDDPSQSLVHSVAPCVLGKYYYFHATNRDVKITCVNTLINNYIHIHFKTQLYASVYLYINNTTIHIYSYYSHATM